MELRQLEPRFGKFYSAVFSPDGKTIAAGGENSIFRWDIATGSEKEVLEGHSGQVSSLVFSPDGNRIVSASSDKSLRIWDVASDSELTVLDGHKDEVLCVAYSPNGGIIASGSKDKTIRTWNATSYGNINEPRGHGGHVNSIAFSPDSTRIVSGSSDNKVRIWDAMNGLLIVTYEGHGGDVTSVAYSIDNVSIVSGSHDYRVCVLNTETGFWTTLQANGDSDDSDELSHSEWVQSVGYSPDGQRIISGGDDCMIRIWDAVSGKMLTEFDNDMPINLAAFSPDGTRIVSVSEEERLDVYEVIEEDLLEENIASGKFSYFDILWDIFKRQKSNVNKPQSIPVKNEIPPLFALIIGINNYESNDTPNLKGAVADSKSVKEWLMEDLNVPESQIKTLFDKEATRAEILKAFDALQNNEKIKDGDPILIFYAGHGGETNPPSNWGNAGEKIQMLIPHDFETKANGRDIHGIPDRTIGAMLDRLAQKKGNNITVMFDCCHSGSATRSLKKIQTPRVVSIKNDVPVDLDSEIWGKQQSGERGAKVVPAFNSSGLRSHVLLAACGALEKAKEEDGRGVFTKSAVQIITNVGAHKLTYTNLIHRIPTLSGQNPQCEGYHRGRILFNSKAPSQGRLFHSMSQNDNTVVMSAGTEHGITKGAEFAVYQDASSKKLGTLVVQDSTAFSSTLVMSPGEKFQVPDSALALQTMVGEEEDLRLTVAMHPKLKRVFVKILEEMLKEGPSRRNIVPVESKKAEFGIAIEDNDMVFDVCDPLITQYGLTRLPFRLHPTDDNISSVISAAAHYHWHLRLNPQEQTLQGKLRFEFMQLRRVREGTESAFQPIGTNLNLAGIVELSSDDEHTNYGISITNNSTWTLYPSLLFFDTTKYSMELIYPLTDGNQEALLPNTTLSIGYGSERSVPFSYPLDGRLNVGVGFLKLFLDTKQEDYSNLQQTFDPETTHWGNPQSKLASARETRTVALVVRRPPQPFILDEGTYFIRNLKGAYLESPRGGTWVINNQRNNDPGQKWTLKKGTRGYTFKCGATGTYLFSSGKQDGTIDTARVTCSQDSCEWEVIKAGDEYQIQLVVDPYLVLDLLGSQNVNGIPIIAWPYDDGPNQRWIFERVTI